MKKNIEIPKALIIAVLENHEYESSVFEEIFKEYIVRAVEENWRDIAELKVDTNYIESDMLQIVESIVDTIDGALQNTIDDALQYLSDNEIKEYIAKSNFQVLDYAMQSFKAIANYSDIICEAAKFYFTTRIEKEMMGLINLYIEGQVSKIV